ncbi:MAG: RNA polymerase sigma factor [Candidatus Moranbacteria bacterium]|nr:RNA polymerase sigma factor [Candidatus Moranbacteria bacterium]
MNDNQLILKILDGDEEAFAEIVKIYLKAIYNFVYRLTGDRDAAEDLTQETFVKAWKNLKRFDQSKNFKTWLFTIAKNTAYDWLKKKKEIPFSSFTDDEGENWLENVADENILPDEILERSDLAEELEKILEKLSVHYRAILILHYKEDFSLHEIAEILDEPYNTIKSRHQRGLGRLKIELTQN